MITVKNLFLIFFSIALLFSGCSSDSKEDNENPPEESEIVLYDQDKEAIAYIDYNDEATIYTFEGEPVAYIQSKDQVYGFNGKLLGWYSDGVLYDKTYYAVGAKHGIVRGGINTAVTGPERIKSIKQVKPVKQEVEENDFVHPVLKDSWSETTLTEFFNAGKK